MRRLLTFATLLLATFPLSALADETICADTYITGTHDNVIVPPGTVCGSSADTYITGSVKVFGGYNAETGTTIEGNLDGEPGHLFVRLFGPGVVVRGNVQLKKAAAPAEVSGYTPGTEIWGNFHWEENPNFLFADGGSIGGDLKMEKSTGGGVIFGNIIRGDLQCKENAPPPDGRENTVRGNKEDQCAVF
jgi:hypothetical protein